MNKTPSNEGSSSGIADVKYQKAIKEISKLISLNTALKKQNTTLLQNYDKIVLEYDNFKDRVKQMGSIDFQDGSVSGLEKTAAEDSTRCFSSKGQESKYILGDRNVEDFHNAVEEKDKIISLLNEKIDGLNQQNRQLTLKLSNAHDQVSKFKNFVSKKDFQDLQKQNKKLKKELLQATSSLEKMCKDYSELQKQLADDIPNANNTQKGQFKDPLSEFYIEKLKRVEQENLKLRKENTEKKNKLKSQIGKLRQDNEQKLAKLMYLTSFVEKQQHFIEKFIIAEKPPIL